MKSRGIKGLILAFFSIILVGLLIVTFSSNNAQSLNASSAPQNESSDTSQTIAKMKSMAEALENRLKASPEDVEIQLALANTYYDMGAAAQSGESGAEAEYFTKAVDYYREVAKSKDDVNILVDMATAAFYAHDNQTAQDTFEKAIQMNPKSYEAHYNYGVFLLHAKEDYTGSLREWKAALEVNPNAPNVERLKQLISGVEEQLKAANPAPKS